MTWEMPGVGFGAKKKAWSGACRLALAPCPTTNLTKVTSGILFLFLHNLRNNDDINNGYIAYLEVKERCRLEGLA